MSTGLTRGFLRTLCRTLIGVVLFAQLAIAAYACPGMSSAAAGTMQMSSIDESQQAVDCAGMAGPMDSSFANLCAEHCRHGQQSDHAPTLNVPAAVLTALYITPLAPEPFVASRPAADATSALAAASPPLAILHCCFRI